MWLGTDDRSKLRQAVRLQAARVLAAVDRGIDTPYLICEALDDDPTYREVVDILTVAEREGLVRESDGAGGHWAIVARRRTCRHQHELAGVLGVGTSTVSRWTAEGIACDPPAYWESEKGQTFPCPGEGLLKQGVLRLDVPQALVAPPVETGPPAPVVTVADVVSPSSPDRVVLPTRLAASLALGAGLETEAGRALAERVLRVVASGQ